MKPAETALAAVGEIGELSLNKDFLPWKKANDIDNIHEEITDILFFVLELYLLYGIEDWSKVEKMYTDKLNKNYSRPDHEWSRES